MARRERRRFRLISPSTRAFRQEARGLSDYSFFDWLHGKWHDGFCPVGPCLLDATDCVDPQELRLSLKVNGEIKQDATTAQQIFPVAAIIEFVSSFVTLEPGDLISTGTPAGVGNTTKTYLKAGDELEAEVEGIGVLRNRMVAQKGA